jgi:DNA-binding NarL/FixJ family response regulator
MGGLEATGHRSRCIQPNVKLAELRLLQGRIEEAERLLAGTDDLPEATRPLAALHLAKGEASVAAAILLRELNRIGDTVAAIPLLSLLVEVQVAQGSLDEAGATLHRLSAIVERSAHPRYVGLRDLAAGRIARARGDGAARELLSSAVTTLTQVEARLEAARARFELAATLVDEAPGFATREARAALDAFEAIGASREADAAAAFVRDLGGPARTGPKLIGTLSKRELEVLRLLAEGLSNAEIAARLYISTKTAGNHVSNVLAKLGVRNRAEAAALAARGGREPVG